MIENYGRKIGISKERKNMGWYMDRNEGRELKKEEKEEIMKLKDRDEVVEKIRRILMRDVDKMRKVEWWEIRMKREELIK